MAFLSSGGDNLLSCFLLAGASKRLFDRFRAVGALSEFPREGKLLVLLQGAAAGRPVRPLRSGGPSREYPREGKLLVLRLEWASC